MDDGEQALIEDLVKLGNDLQGYTLNDMNNNSDISDCSSNNLKGKTRDSEYYKKKMEIGKRSNLAVRLKRNCWNFW